MEKRLLRVCQGDDPIGETAMGFQHRQAQSAAAAAGHGGAPGARGDRYGPVLNRFPADPL